jgi:hypothetical protein
VQRTGYDESAVATVIPAHQFVYASSSQLFVAQSDNGSGGLKATSGAYVVSDINGNGKNDIALFYRGHYHPYSLNGTWYLDQGGYSSWYQNQTLNSPLKRNT